MLLARGVKQGARTQGALPATRWLSDWAMNQERFVPLRETQCIG